MQDLNTDPPGSETTGYTMAWVLYLLAKHPAAMAKLERELDDAGLLVTPARPRPRPFTFYDISKLPYLDAVLKARQACGRIDFAKGHISQLYDHIFTLIHDARLSVFCTKVD